MSRCVCYQCGTTVEQADACWVRRRWSCRPCVQQMIDDMKKGLGYDPPEAPVATGKQGGTR